MHSVAPQNAREKYGEELPVTFYERKKAKRNAVVAIKAVAHKLARAAYYVMRDRVPFDIQKAFG